MKDRLMQLVIMVFSTAVAVCVVTIFFSDRLYSAALRMENVSLRHEKAVSLLDRAIKLDPYNAALYFRKYEMLDAGPKDVNVISKRKYMAEQVRVIKRCIALCPSWPDYHFYYARTLIKMSPYPNIKTKETILLELDKAAKLKPYSDLYRGIADSYKSSFSK